MKLLEDEPAYRHAIDDFVGRRSSAEMFIPLFLRLWKRDAAACGASALAAHECLLGAPGLYGLLDGINTLCEAYEASLRPGAGYRVSAEQFRKEIECVTCDGVLRVTPH